MNLHEETRQVGAQADSQARPSDLTETQEWRGEPASPQ